jgi:hypothetical protein
MAISRQLHACSHFARQDERIGLAVDPESFGGSHYLLLVSTKQTEWNFISRGDIALIVGMKMIAAVESW